MIDDNDFDLVHSQGKASNEQNIIDPDFGVSAPDAYRLIRTVEMYQTQEIVTETKNNDRTERHYSYKDGWFTSPISSSNFNDSNKQKNNPSIEWPYTSRKFEADTV